MSAVLKRRFNSLDEKCAPRCSPGRIKFLTLADARRKRSRKAGMERVQEEVSFDVKARDLNANVKRVVERTKRTRSANEMDTEDAHHIKRIRRPEDFKEESQSSIKPNNPFVAKNVNVAWNPKKKKYTEEQVRKIVQAALREQEEKLREQYNRILNERLAEQFENFTSFNQDYVYRHMKSKPCSYVS
ncbi:hypothetical protein AAMO2058_001544100 [Amorphochlora amoebiformis]|uniref:Uncharacterized protein n=1 Tax=Amorphochlora amoebiformis TaxID=1561963 RepID=A0A7S0DPQ5_9EUKA|mmetsp:Transcript_34906/g.56315  ORF Transcript_34906/g.56315 Transcript_34906/m.56315 type:complete len:187 (+) Transcript_34906:49-609(+)|eukprot:1332488-Amorphochlora_amoeboformis.AAC.1